MLIDIFLSFSGTGTSQTEGSVILFPAAQAR